MSDGFLKLNVIIIKLKKNNNNNNASSSAYLLEFSGLCHGILRYVNYYTLRRLINLYHILFIHIDPKHKRETCVEAKQTRSFF